MAKDQKHKVIWMIEEVNDPHTGEVKSFWTKVGIAFENRDGSYSINLSAIPVNGRLQMRDPKPAG